MGLGVALTGFLTGFAERATDILDERNKEIRERYQKRLDLHAAQVQEQIEEKKKLRKEYVERVNILHGMGLNNVNPNKLGALVTNDVMYKKLIDRFSTISEGDRKKAVTESLKYVSDSPYKYNTPEQYINAVLGDRLTISPIPLPTQTKTAFGLRSPQQQKMSEDYALSLMTSYPREFTGTADTPIPRGFLQSSIGPETDITEPQIRSRASTNVNEILKSIGIFPEGTTQKDKFSVQKISDSFGTLRTVVTGKDKEAINAINFAKLKHVHDVFDGGYIGEKQRSFYVNYLDQIKPEPNINKIKEKLKRGIASSQEIANDIQEILTNTNSIYFKGVKALNENYTNIFESVGVINKFVDLPVIDKKNRIQEIINLTTSIPDKNSGVYLQNESEIEKFNNTVLQPIYKQMIDLYKNNGTEKQILDLVILYGFDNKKQFESLLDKYREYGLI